MTRSHVKTTRYCIEVAASAIYLKLIEAYQRSSSDMKPIEWLEEVSKTSPMYSYWRMILGCQIEILLYVRSLRESGFQLYVSALACIISNSLPWIIVNMLRGVAFIYLICQL